MLIEIQGSSSYHISLRFVGLFFICLLFLSFAYGGTHVSIHFPTFILHFRFFVRASIYLIFSIMMKHDMHNQYNFV